MKKKQHEEIKTETQNESAGFIPQYPSMSETKDSDKVTIGEVKSIMTEVLTEIKEIDKKEDIEKIDWESKIDPQYIVLNRQKKDEIEKVYGKKFYDIDVVADNVDRKKYCLVLLQGMRDLLDTRGYESVNYSINYCSPEFVSATCHIRFTPLYRGQPLKNRTYSFGADAHRGNTMSWYGQYLTAAAFNRAMCLCLRNALKINTVCYEEIGADIKEEDAADAQTLAPAGPHYTLSKKLDEKNTSFEKVKEGCIKKGFAGAESWNSLKDIPVDDVRKILEGIKEKESKFTTS